MPRLARNAEGRHPGETLLAALSLALLVPYVPGETWLEWPHLLGPGYLVDVLAWVLLAHGALHSLRARPRPAPGPLCGAWGFVACLAWRTYFTRVVSAERGIDLYADEPDFVRPLLGALLPLALAAFAASLCLARAPRHAR